ncbi:MAG TPA: DUF362 domain-containing protein [Methanoregulaceae archaeon]|nr:DUF362 domain-containing protein [Methanoregulaceae archaeon]
MAEKVYFANLRARDPDQNTITKIRKLFDAAEFSSIIRPGDITAIKIHFGERGNDSYINPVYVRQVVDKIKEYGGRLFLTDSNTLYRGSRADAVDHLTTAIEHGFAYAVVGAPLLIADGLYGNNTRKIRIDCTHFREVIISGDIADSRSMVVLSHFKGHEIAGYGGAIKNLAMGCAPPVGKQKQHSARPMIIEEQCRGCASCIEVCPREAISLVNGKAVIERESCIGCFECMTICPERAIDVDWETDIPVFVERMVEYAFGAVKGKQDKVAFMNFLTRITPDCDCVAWSDASIVPDIGILASKDPVAIDAASFDLVNSQEGFPATFLARNHSHGKDKFRGMRNETDGYRQILYAEQIGLGSAEYELIEIS